MGRLPSQCAGNAGGNALAGHIGQFLVHQLGRIGAALADQAGIQPLLGDPLELAEQVQFGLFTGVAPFGVEQTLGEMKQERGAAQIAGMDEVEVNALADDSLDSW